MSDLSVVQIRNPAGLEIPEVRELIERGFDASHVLKGKPGAIEAIAEMVERETSVVFMARCNNEWVGYIALEFNPIPNPFVIPAWITYLYSDGSNGLVHKLVDAMLEWMKETGIDTIHWINQSGRTDEQMAALSDLFESDVVGSVMKSTIKE